MDKKAYVVVNEAQYEKVVGMKYSGKKFRPSVIISNVEFHENDGSKKIGFLILPVSKDRPMVFDIKDTMNSFESSQEDVLFELVIKD